jgi:hypothetical protein
MANYHEDVEELRIAAVRLEDERLRELVEVLSTELDRRRIIGKGLDAGEELRFDETLRLIKERTRLHEEDALAMIRAHVPKPVRKRLPHE